MRLKENPMMKTEDLKGGVLMPGDGAADPSGVTLYASKSSKTGRSKNTREISS